MPGARGQVTGDPQAPGLLGALPDLTLSLGR